jgi:hypothetical protein
LDPVTGWSEDKDLSQLKEFLDKQAPSGQHKARLMGLPDKKFNLWINSAIAAQRLIEGEDFDVPESKTEAHVAVPYNLKAPQVGSTFSKGIQQFLHARLQKQYASKGWTFAIEPEMLFIDSVSTKDLMDDYKQIGRVVGLSGTLGTVDELVEQRDKFNIDVACRIPPHLENQRQEQHTKITGNRTEHLEKIADAIRMAEEGQPIVLIAQDANEVKYFETKLKEYFEKTHTIGAFTGKEAKEDRQKWVSEQAGKNNTITIATSLLGRGTDFDTAHLKGFLAIQSYLDSPRITRQIIGRVARNGKPGQYVAIYEDRGSFFSKSWFYKSAHDRKTLISEISALQKQRNAVMAVERHYIQTVSGIQQVVMKQFEEWQAFLRLLYPLEELSQLNNNLLTEREDLINSLGEKWQECLEKSDLDKKYDNPYERRDVHGKLQTSDLDKALNNFESEVVALWSEKCAVLKTKAKDKIVAGSVDELRADYMAHVSLAEQLKLNRLAPRQNRKNANKELKRVHRYVSSGLDFNGAMLRYSDGDLEKYRVDFEQSQTLFFKKDIALDIKNNFDLTRSIRQDLLTRINDAKDLDDLAWLLNEYAIRWLPEDSFAKKYTMQPIIRELLHVYAEIGLEETPNLQQLRKVYLDNVSIELIDELEHTLSWAVEGNRGLGYLLERTAVTNAASDILQATKSLDEAKTPELRQLAMKQLYKVLMHHQMQLEGLWIFSFGHKNTRTLIKQTLATLDSLTVIGSREYELSAEFIRDCKEEAVYSVMRGRFDSAFTSIEKKDKTKIEKENNEWQRIKESLCAIQRDCDNVYAFDEMNYFIETTLQELHKNDSKLVDPVTHLRSAIRKIWHDYKQKHAELMDMSKYFELKAAKIKTQLSQLDGLTVESVTLKQGHNGFSDYLDLIIEAKGTHSTLADFTQYTSQVTELTQMKETEDIQLQQAKELSLELAQFESQQLPLLKYGIIETVDIEQIPERFQSKVQEIIQLKNYASGEVPTDLSAYPDSMQNDFHDRELLNTFDFFNLDLEKIAKLKNEHLQQEFIALNHKILDVGKPRSLWSMLWFGTESEEDLRYQFSGLKNGPNSRLQAIFSEDITKKQTVLVAETVNLHQETQVKKETHKKKKIFLSEKIAEEKAKGGVYSKRFSDMAAVYEFEKQLPQMPPVIIDEDQDIDESDVHEQQKDEDHSERPAPFYL